MCGIAGIFDPGETESCDELLCAMLGLIRHRGPDSFGIYRDRTTGLASSRLSIIDPAGGNQPIHNEDRSVWIVYNGEVFNYPELKCELEKKGHRFYTASDTEVIVHLYEEYSQDLFERLNGQFALALWDRNSGALTLGRDRLGVRPLFYHYNRGRMIFASEIKAIFADPRVPRDFDYETLSDIFTCWSPFGSKTVFKNITQLEPGHYAVLSRDGLMTCRYWNLSFPVREGSDGRSSGEWIEELDGLLCDAVRIRLRADVPVGAYLSGGLDSTLLTSVIKKRFENRLCTFSVGFSDGRFDETEHQKRAIAAIGTEHQAVYCREEDIGAVLPDVVWHAEQPILRTAPAPLFLLSDLVHQNSFKVVLTGEGADELFAGYDIFKEDKISRFWAREPSSKFRPLVLRRIYPDVFDGERGAAPGYIEAFFKKGLLNTDSAIYSHRIRWENTAVLKSFFSDDLKSQLADSEPFAERYAASLPPDFMRWDPLSRAQYTEICLFLSNYLLSAQGDRMAMAHSVEGRFPFLDHRVVETACRIPPRMKMSGLREKYILRKAAERYLPVALAARPKKPYRAPISRCLFGNGPIDYENEILSEKSLKRTGYFNPRQVSRLVEKCKRQNGLLFSERENMALIGIVTTELLAARFLTGFPGRLAAIPAPECILRYSPEGKQS